MTYGGFWQSFRAQEREHDWKSGVRIGEAKKPGPPSFRCSVCMARRNKRQRDAASAWNQESPLPLRREQGSSTVSISTVKESQLGQPLRNFSKVMTKELGYAERCYPCASSWQRKNNVYRRSFNLVNNVNNGRGRRFLNEGHCVDLMTHGIAHPPFRDSVRCVSGSRVRGRAQYGGQMTGIQWQDQAHNLVGRGGNARKHGVGRGRGGPATRYQSSSRGRMGMGVASRRERSHCNRGEGNPTNGFDGQKPVLQEQLQQKFCWFGNHCKYPYCPYWHEVCHCAYHSRSSCQSHYPYLQQVECVTVSSAILCVSRAK